MSMREKDQADFDLEQFVDLFDTAMMSDNPTVRRAFKNLLMVAAIADSDNTNTITQGPLRRLLEDVKNMNQRLSVVENKNAWAPPASPYTPPTSVPLGPWPNTGPYPYTSTGTSFTGPYNGPTSSTTISYPGMSSTAYDDQFKVESDYDPYSAILNKLETK